MKKFLSICLAALLVITMSFTVFAKPGEFVQSPSNNPAPDLVGGTNQSEDCTAKLIITAFIERFTAPENVIKMLEKAYKDIATVKNLVELCADLAEVAVELGILEKNLAVSDLFDISYVGCDDHNDHGYFDIVLKSETLNNFVALMHLTDDGWVIVDNARVEEVDGEWHLYFSVDSFSPFAVVVNAATVVDGNPNTGDNNNLYIYTALLAAAAVVFVLVLKKTKKQSA